jgi:hypothetical protein
MTGLLWLAGVLGLLALAVLGLAVLGQRRWAARTQALQQQLEGGRIDARRDTHPPPTRYTARELEGLPVPVQRYFRAVLTEGQPIITAVTVELAGTMNLSPTGSLWRPFTSRQRAITRRPGFLWDAKISLGPGLSVRVVDSYIVGNGLLHASIQGLFTVARLQGEGDIARDEGLRWLAEMAWYPTALLPSQGARWEAIDDRSAKVTLVDGLLSLSLLFRFNEAGLIDSFRAEARGSSEGGQTMSLPWEGAWSNYQTCDGVRVPLTGEVAWMRPVGRRPYFVGTVTALRFEFAP